MNQALIPEIKPEQSIELLKELHILTREGKLNQDTRRKLKQVYHLYQFIEPLMADVIEHKNSLNLVDHGAGKSYLGFILYDLYLKNKANVHVYGIETRADLVKKSQHLAERLGFAQGMSFKAMSVEESMATQDIPDKVDIVTALHACNTATDDAIRFGLARHARYMVLVPCCQAEVASIFRKTKGQTLGKTPLSELWRHPIHTREFGSHLTNVLRCLQLEARGYQVTVTELVGWEHSMKNELIIAKKVGGFKRSARERQLAILEQYHLLALKERFAYD
ncbi:SAM-dependent methyltransferase [Pelistega sp. NLN82]|uniref:SAM-dependent methyltransferase n=1 Tax=Pelistega ratti TaxID=2652177 RepID=A0A6L9Y4G9_9BURK|nr:SAM-dependent methyltransferase [Pelistega ratti]NEN75243.1 SAM-dependent methyltransferase [Pelistega ratti]